MQCTLEELKVVARNLRITAVKMVHRSRASHLGSCLSIADILACLYWKELSIDAARPDWTDRDRFILSKGHAAAIMYATLANRGFFPTAELDSYCEFGSRLTGHITSGVPGVELSSGSLGHGLPVACGIALAAKREQLCYRTVVLCSDGELDEGSNWEAILFAPQHRLDNLLLIIDFNKIQSFGRVEEVMNLNPLVDKFVAFGWAAREVDGHDIEQLSNTLSAAPFENSKPSVVIAHTIKGKGISFMEDSLAWHYKSPSLEQLDLAIAELERGL